MQGSETEGEGTGSAEGPRPAARTLAELLGAPTLEAALAWESKRREAMEKAVGVLEAFEARGLKAGLFGSVLRAGDFFGNSDADFACEKPGRAPFGAREKREIKMEAAALMDPFGIDVVFVPTEGNLAFGERVSERWMSSARTLKAALSENKTALREPFRTDDVAFVCSDRLEIATAAARKAREDLAVAGLAAGSEGAQAPIWRARACAESVERILEKCAKDVLRHCVGSGAALWTGRLFPLLALPVSETVEAPAGAQALAAWANLAAASEAARGGALASGTGPLALALAASAAAEAAKRDLGTFFERRLASEGSVPGANAGLLGAAAFAEARGREGSG